MQLSPHARIRARRAYWPVKSMLLGFHMIGSSDSSGMQDFGDSLVHAVPCLGRSNHIAIMSVLSSVLRSDVLPSAPGHCRDAPSICSTFCHVHLADEIEAQSQTYFMPFMHILSLNPSKERLFKLHVIVICRRNVSLSCTKSWKNSRSACAKACLQYIFFFICHMCHIHQLVFHAGKWGRCHLCQGLNRHSLHRA